MDEKFYRRINNFIQDTITAYEELIELYKEKKQALLKADKDMLTFVDDKILAQVKFITKINKEREDYCNENDSPTIKLTELINSATIECPQFEEVFSVQKVKINELAEEMALIEKTNVELIKHNLIMSDKLLDIIVSAATPQKDNYDMHGKNIDTTELSISSIVEDA